MTYEKIMQDLQKKIYQPVYFLHGDEPYFIDKISDHIEKNVLKEEEKAFNQTVAYGKDTDVRNLVSLARKFPMMANHQVIILKEAQDLQKIEELVHYLQSPLKSTILAICYKYKKPDKRKKYIKLIEEKGTLFESKKLYDNKIPAWITGYSKKKGLAISPRAATMLSEYLGNDLTKITMEIDKLSLVIPEGTKSINPSLIEKNIGISKDYNNFELVNALADKNYSKSMAIVHYFGANPKEHPIQLSLVMLFNFFSKVLIYKTLKDKNAQSAAAKLKISPYYLKTHVQAAKKYPGGKLVKIIHALREYDLRSKGVNNRSVPPGELFKELVFYILY